ncbi:helitron_like_N domain-containing protein [Trichonephila clavipes]|nr:helitron_like_N domain-containing protein [Trichonephila clavipes]
MPADDFAVVIRADKRPVGQHERQFNAPTIDEVAIVIVGVEFESRDIILHCRSGDIQRVSETHRSYDGLQYPILFWRGDDRYHFNIKMINPQTVEGTNKKVSAMNYYSYRLMIRQNAENHILKCRQLFHQYIVDMYAKIETERLLYIRLNQTECVLNSTSIYETQSLMMITSIQTNWEEWPYYRLHSRGVHATCMNTHKMR